MALNGLDSSNVKDAYKAALADPGGWLLLCYTSRDEVDVHQRGNGGVAELAEALTDYPAKSPLYGFLQYRNNKIIVKYIPQGTSRLLQARTSVHWSSVSDTLAPHDALFEATLPQDLNDEALSALCGLAPEAMPAISPARTPEPAPSMASRPITPQAPPKSPPISEISAHSRSYFDDAQTPRTHTRTPNQASTSAVSAISIPSPSRSARRDLERPDTRGTDSLDRPATQPVKGPKYEPQSSQARSLAAFLNEGPPSSFASRQELELREFSPSPDSSYRPSNDLLDVPRTAGERSGRPSTSDIWRSFKPKLKLGPRPVDQNPQGLSGVRQKLPSGLKVRSRKTEKTDERPKSRKSEKNIHVPDQIMTSATAPPRTSSRPNLANDRRARSPLDEPPLPPLPTEIEAQVSRPRPNGLATTAPSPSPDMTLSVPPTPPAKPDRPPNGFSSGRRNPNLGVDTKSAQINRMSADTFALLSPEKQRLMKALEQRKRQFNAAQQQEQQQLQEESQRAEINEGHGTFLDLVSPAKTDSGVDIEEIRAAEAERSRPFAENPMGSTTSLVANPPRPSTARRHNPALQSHPVGDVESFASPPSQPPLPPPPRDLFGQKRDRSIPRKEVPRPATSNDSHSQSTERAVQTPTEDSWRRPDRRHGFLQTADSHEQRPSVSREDSVETSDGLTRNTMFIRELESATVQEATSKPMAAVQTSVGGGSRSATPVLIERSASRRNRPTPAETIANAPVKGGSRSPSPEFVRPSTSQGPAADRSAMNKRVNVSTGISRRIQVLAELHSSDREVRGGSPYGAHATYDPTESFLAPSALPQMGNSSQSFLAKSYDESRGSSPDRSTRRGFGARRPSNDSQRTADTLLGRKRDTVSITAHIQRAPQQSRPLIIEEEGMDESPAVFAPPIHSRTVSRTSTSRTDGHRPGSSHSNRPVSRGSTVTSFTRTSLDVWRSGGSRRFQSSMRPPTSVSNVSLDRVDEVSETNRSSRTSKLLKRMSGIGGSRQKAPSEGESVPSMEERRMLSPPRPTSIIVGDLNVQFPDSLLWKRRWVEVDGNGNLVLSASPSADRPNGSRKKFHLADFRTPTLPGQDRAEQPHSIKLDFAGGGGTLQLATEDPIGQASILRRLGDAHRAWLYYES